MHMFVGCGSRPRSTQARLGRTSPRGRPWHAQQGLLGEVAHGDLLLLAEVDQLAVDAEAEGAELVLVDERRRVLAEAEVLRAELQQLGADRLDERGQADDLVDPGAGVADAELDRRVLPVGAQVPPDALAVVDGAGPDQQLHVVLEVVVGGELRRDAAAREARPDHAAVGLEAGAPVRPEGAGGRQRQQVRQEVARLVHHLDARLRVGDADVHVHAEDQQLADQVLHLLLEQLVALHLGDALVLPAGERVGAGRHQPEPLRLHQRGEAAAQAVHLGAGLVHARADAGADLHHRLQQLGLDVLAEPRPGGGQQLVDVRLQRAVAVDDLELLFDPDGELLPGHADRPRVTLLAQACPVRALAIQWLAPPAAGRGRAVACSRRMRGIELLLLGLMVAVVGLSVLARSVGVPYPIMLVLGGLALGFLPGVPAVELPPELVLVLFLPPLLYWAAFFSSPRELLANLRTISLLAGESLVNDATALVAYRIAVAAAVGGSFVVWHAGLRFVAGAAGGAAIGLAVGWLVAGLPRRLDDPPIEIVLSLLTGYAAYLPAERLGGSRGLAVVTAGFLGGRRRPPGASAPGSGW